MHRVLRPSGKVGLGLWQANITVDGLERFGGEALGEKWTNPVSKMVYPMAQPENITKELSEAGFSHVTTLANSHEVLLSPDQKSMLASAFAKHPVILRLLPPDSKYANFDFAFERYLQIIDEIFPDGVWKARSLLVVASKS